MAAVHCTLAFALAAAALAGAPAHAQAQASPDVNAEARVYFERGNRKLDEAMGARDERRRALLEEALKSYVDSLRIVRSRNAVFNAALTLEQLGRLDEAFAYYSEYLGMPGLSEAERTQATHRRDALRDRVAVVGVASDPPGAQVYVDRLDLAPRGRTPLELALPAGEHTLFLEKLSYARARLAVEARVGERTEASATLTPVPVTVRVETTARQGQLTVDGRAATAGAPVDLAPGEHVVRLSLPGRAAVERRFRVPVGAEPMTVRIEPPPPAAKERGAAAATPETRPVRRFGRLPAWLGVGTAALGAVTLGLAIHARHQRGELHDFRKARCPGDPPLCETQADLDRLRELDRDVHRSNVAADVFLWTTVAVGTATVVLALLNRSREQRPSSVALGVAPAPGGGAVEARIPFGGVR